MMSKTSTRRLCRVVVVCLALLAGCRTLNTGREYSLPEEGPVRREYTEEEKLRLMQERVGKTVVPPVNFVNADIREVIEGVMTMTGLDFVLDEGAISGLPPKETLKVTVRTVNKLPLPDVLDIILGPHDFGYTVKNSYIWITHKSKLKNPDDRERY